MIQVQSVKKKNKWKFLSEEKGTGISIWVVTP